MQEEADEDAEEGAATKTAEGGFVRGGATYRVGDCFYVPPDTFEQVEDPDAVKPEVPSYVAKSRFHKGGANAGLRAFGVAKLLGLKKTQGQVRKPTGALQCNCAWDVVQLVLPDYMRKSCLNCQCCQHALWEVKHFAQDRAKAHVNSCSAMNSCALAEQHALSAITLHLRMESVQPCATVQLGHLRPSTSHA